MLIPGSFCFRLIYGRPQNRVLYFIDRQENQGIFNINWRIAHKAFLVLLFNPLIECCWSLGKTELHCTVMYCTVFYYTVLYFTVLQCTILCSTVLFCTVLYCAGLDWTGLQKCGYDRPNLVLARNPLMRQSTHAGNQSACNCFHKEAEIVLWKNFSHHLAM